MSIEANLTFLAMIGLTVLAVTFATWNERTWPPRSTSERTAFFGAGSLKARFLALPPT